MDRVEQDPGEGDDADDAEQGPASQEREATSPRARAEQEPRAVPETFVVDKQGVIRHKHAGPITAEFVSDELIPLIETLNKES